MQHTRPHNRRDFQRPNAQRPSVDGFKRPGNASSYQRRADGILPATENEYMISLGSRASRREESVSVPDSFFVRAQRKIQSQFAQIKPMSSPPSFIAIIALGVVVLFGGSFMFRSVSSVTANKDAELLLQDNGDTPHDKLPYNQPGYAVATDLPRFLNIRKLGISSRVVRLSVRESSEPKYPSNIYDVGWYENSAKPGEEGAALLIGHTNGSEKPGVFHDLTNLVPGDEFQLEMGDGSIKNFYIVKMHAYDRNNVDFNELTQSALPEKPGLNLLTAVGAFESNANVVQQLGVFAVEKTSFQD